MQKLESQQVKKRMHILLTTNSLLLQRLRLGPFQFQMRKESHSHTLCIELQIPKLTDVSSSTNKIHCVSTFVYIRNPFALLINLKQFIIKKQLLDSLHHLNNQRVCYNDITKKTCSIPDALSKPLKNFPPKNARGRNDRDYNCDCYTHFKVLNMI